MVLSKLDSSVTYAESRQLSEADTNQLADVYDLEIFGNVVSVAIGARRTPVGNSHITYFPLYLVKMKNMKNTKPGNDDPAEHYVVDGQLGVYETESHFVPNTEIDLDLAKTRGEILLFAHANELVRDVKPTSAKATATTMSKETASKNKKDKNAKNSLSDKVPPSDIPSYLSSANADDSVPDENTNANGGEGEEEEEEGKEKKEEGSKSSPEYLLSTLWEKDANIRSPMPLLEETKSESSELMKSYRDQSMADPMFAQRNASWIQQYLFNAEYRILPNEGGSDGVFAAIRDAYREIGKVTTVAKLRSLLAAYMTDEIFQEKRRMFLQVEHQIAQYVDQLAHFTEMSRNFKYQLETPSMASSLTKKEHARILREAKSIKPQFERVQLEKRTTEQYLASDVGFIRHIETLEQMREFMKTSEYWADEWAIGELERALRLKTIVLSEQLFQTKDVNNVLVCGKASDELRTSGVFSPDHYVILSAKASASGTGAGHQHYDLVSYKKHALLRFREVPYALKVLVVNKCMEHNAGPFSYIQEMRNFKTNLGVKADEGIIDDDTSDDVFVDDATREMRTQLQLLGVNTSIKFMFHETSDERAAPGKGTGESIPEYERTAFLPLQRLRGWRRMLDDTWMGSPFIMDGKTYASVTHYVESAKFKQGAPDFAAQFTVDSNSALSQSASLARAAGCKTGMCSATKRQIRPKNVFVDTGYSRHLEDRELALSAKFTQHLDLRQALLATYPANLLQYVRGKPSEPDILLMKLRSSFHANV